jgi:phasin family protein
MTTFTSLSASQALKTIEELVEFSRHSLDNTMQAGSRAASTSYHHAVLNTEEKMDAATATGAEMAALQQGTIKAAMQSSTILFDGMQELTRDMVSVAQKAIENGVAHSKATRGAKSIHQFVQMNQDYAKNRMAKAVAEGTRLTEQSMKLAEQAAQPVTLHISENVLPQVNEKLAAVLNEMIKAPGELKG